MKPIIEVSGISKSYQISHQVKAGANYNTLKDDFANMFKKSIGQGRKDEKETFWALKDVSFEVQQGEIFGIIGQNGSGKSTLLKILSRIVDPTNGTAKLNGRVASLLEVGTGFHPELTGRENIFLNGSMLGMSRQEIRKKFDEIVEFSEVEKFLDTPVKFYSSGMYVRLAFSVAAFLEPEILVLDEVLAVGDAAFQQKSFRKILSTMEEGRTVLFVSHSMSTVRQLCSRGVLLRKGKVAFNGPVGELIDHYMVYNKDTEKDEDVIYKLGPEWKSKKDGKSEYFDLEEVVTLDEHGKNTLGKFRNDADHWVSISGTLKTTDERFKVGYAAWDSGSKNLIYMSMSTDSKKEDWPKLKKGPVTFLGKIPKHFLNEGDYKITAIASIDGKFWIFDPEGSPARVEIKIRGGLSDSPQWGSARGGFMAPAIEWRLE